MEIYLSPQNNFCQYSTIISELLFNNKIFIGICSSIKVFNSVFVILKLPSPSIDITILSGFANLAPIAYPSDTPIVPNEPDDNNVFGCVHVIN